MHGGLSEVHGRKGDEFYQGRAGERTLGALPVRPCPRRFIHLLDYCVSSCREDSSRVPLEGVGSEGRVDGLGCPGRHRLGLTSHRCYAHVGCLVMETVGYP